MIPYQEIFESLPFAIACCKVADASKIDIQSIQLEYSNSKFQELIAIHSKTQSNTHFFNDMFYNEKNAKQVISVIERVLLEQKQEKMVYYSMDLKQQSTLLVSPIDQKQFVIFFYDECKSNAPNKLTKKQLESTNFRFDQIAEFGRIFVWEIDVHGKYNYVSQNVTSILGYTQKEMLEKTIFDLYPEKGRKAFKAEIAELFANQEQVKNYENPVINNEGQVIWMQTNGFPIYKENGDLKGYRGFDQDITTRKESQKALAESEEKYRLLTENVSDILWIYNYNQRAFTYFSPSVFNLLGYTVDQVIKKQVSEIMTEDSFRKIRKVLEDNIEAFIEKPVLTHRQLIDIEMFTKDGKTVWTEVSFSFRYNENQEVEIIGVGRDVSDRKLAQQQLQYITFHDSLTGLYNRAYYEEELSRLFVKRNLPLSLILADINDLKLTNDAFGHLEGDKLLQEFASILQENCREDDIVARIGGDEFVLLLPKTDEAATQHIITRINQAISKSSESKLLLSVAMGSMTTHQDSDDFTKLFTVAEDDMYKHKLRNKEDQTEDIVGIIQQSFKVKYPKCYQLCKSTADYAIALAKSLMLPEQEVNNVYYGSLFSLIGTLKEPNISIKDQPKLVVENGYHLLKQIPGFRDVADIVLSIFERVDGKGTPKGLINDEIPRAAKIIRIALDFCITKDETQLANDKVIELLQPNVGIVYDKNLFAYFRLIEQEKAEHETI